MSRRGLAASIALGALLIPSVAIASGPTKQQCVDANEAAQDLRRAGKLREAREKLALCVAQSCPGPVREDCAQRLSEVNAAMPSLVFEAKDVSGNDLSAVQVTIDGQPLADKLDGTAIQVDPGEHHFSFADADGFTQVDKTIVVREGDKDRHLRVVLGASSTTSSGESHQPAASAPNADGNTQRMVGLVVGGAGVVGLVVGSVLGLVSKSTYNQAAPTCRDGSGPCSSQDAQHSRDAHSQATMSTIGFVAGGVLLAGGAVLYFTAPKSPVSMGPTVGLGSAGFSIKGAW